jgi:hypothetical protein
MAAKDRLVGSDATLYKGTVAAAATASGAMSAGAFYKVATVTSGVFYTGIEVGDIVIGDASKTLTAANSAYLITTAEMMDVNEFSIALKSAEIDVTVLADNVTKYRKGKTDMSGTIKGINMVSVMKTAGSVLNRFLRIVNLTTSHVGTLSEVDGSEIIGVFYLQKDATTAGETEAYMVAQIELFGYNLGAAVANAQTFDSGIRIIGNDPIVYFEPNS